MGAAPKLQTFEEMYAAIAALPDGQHGEILGPGWWRTMSRPGARHSRLAKAAIRLLAPVDTTGGGEWWLELEREIEFPAGKLYSPDIAGWRVGDGDLAFVEENPIRRVPDWVCEILSRSTQKADRTIKLPTHAAAGVAHVWIVDLEAETIEVYAPHAEKALLVATLQPGEDHALPPFDLRISLDRLLSTRPPDRPL